MTVDTVGQGMTYDAEARLRTFTDPGTPADNRTYHYDGEGRRVIATGPAGREVFVYDAFGRLAAEYSSGTVPPGPAVGTYYRALDHLGSTRAVINLAGTVQAFHDFTPFGERIGSGIGGRTATHGAAGSFDQQFTGKERDGESGLDYFGFRYMSAAQGRFTGADPDNFDARIDQPRAWNMYTYTWNNPLLYRDDDGRAVNLALAGVGAGVGFVTGFGGSAISQYIDGESVDWGKATAYGAGGAATGSLAGLTFGGTLLTQALAGAAVGTVGSVGGGFVSRGLAGEEVFEGDAIRSDLVNGAVGGAIGSGVQFVGTVVALPPAPKLPNPLGSVRSQLRRLAEWKAWQAQREGLNNKFSTIGWAVGAVYVNVGTQVKSAYDARQNRLSLTWFQYEAQKSKEDVTSRICWADNLGRQVCQ